MTDIEQFLQSESEQAMRRAFREQAQSVMENEEDYRKSNDDFKIGLETEYPVVNDENEPLDSEARNSLIEGLEFADQEVGGAQVEVRTDPMKPESLAEIEREMRSIENDLTEEASEIGAEILRSGTHPLVDLDSIPVTDMPKYDKVTGFHDRHRNDQVQDTFGRLESIDPRDADLAAVINSTQTNVEAPDFETAVERANTTYMISPWMSAISANARFVDGKDTGFADIRMPLWEKSHDIRSDSQIRDETVEAGKLESYYEDLNEYFSRVASEPFILHEDEEALDIGIGTFWKDARLKFKREPEKNRYDAIVESRVVSTQPSIPEEVAMHGFYVGRLAYSEIEDIHGKDGEDLLEIKKVNRNRYSAMHNGLDTKLYDAEGNLRDGRGVLEEEIRKAKIGLEYAGIDDSGYLEVLQDRIERGTPSDVMARGFYEARSEGKDRKDSLIEGLNRQVSWN